MKKKLLPFAFLLLSTVLAAQNWQIINTDDTHNYRSSGSALIDQSVWVDSMALIGNDTLFYLNRNTKNISAPSDSCSFKTNIPHFLSRGILKKNDSYSFFYNSDTLVILPKATLNTSWLADTSNNLHCTLVIEAVRNVFNQEDSIKIFLVEETMDSIILSKSFGVLHFSNPYDEQNYQLVGIDNLQLGETVLNFTEIFSFVPGDIFYYRTVENSFGSSPFSKEEMRKVTVEEVDFLGDMVELSYSQKVRRIVNEGFGDDTTYYSNTYNEQYTISDEPIIQAYPHQITEINSLQDLTGENTYGITEYDKYLDVRKVKRFQSVDNGSCSFFLENDIMEEDTISTSDGGIYSFMLEFREQLGLTKEVISAFEFNASNVLIGYIQDDIEFGSILPDEILTSSVEMANPKSINLYPNPVNDFLYLDQNDFSEGVISIFSSDGKLIYRSAANNFLEPLSVDFLLQGLYFLEIAQEGVIYRNKMLKL